MKKCESSLNYNGQSQCLSWQPLPPNSMHDSGSRPDLNPGLDSKICFSITLFCHLNPSKVTCGGCHQQPQTRGSLMVQTGATKEGLRAYSSLRSESVFVPFGCL